MISCLGDENQILARLNDPNLDKGDRNKYIHRNFTDNLLLRTSSFVLMWMRGVDLYAIIAQIDNKEQAMDETDIEHDARYKEVQAALHNCIFLDKCLQAMSVENGHMWTLHRLLVPICLLFIAFFLQIN